MANHQVGYPTEALSRQVGLIYELLDAHDDTIRMAPELARDLAWASHLHYLRALQRKGREVLAQTSQDVEP